ncbi:MAG TPA: peptide ABC transporter substrate-binding protein [Verrucomicrobiales bacterium]|nr:peptide ABC transporter substrate-binding protein [Verrucomicrobiales bacterium]
MCRPICLVAAAVVALTGCSKPTPAVVSGNREKILHVGNGAEPRDLDPQVITALTDSWILQTLFETLTTIEPATSKPVPAAAHRWEVSEDGIVYTFHLRPEARWSNGDPVTSADFMFAYERMLTPALATEYSYMLWPVKNAEAYNKGELTDFGEVGFSAPDTLTLRIELKDPTPYFPSLVSHQSWSPIHRPTIEKFDAFTRPGTDWTRPGNHVGNGPFQLAEWKPQDFIAVEPNPHYWDAANVKLKGLRFHPIENTATEERAFRGEQLHITYGLPSEKIAAYQKENPGSLRIEPWLETDYLRVNVTRKPLDSVKVRQALGRAIDRKGIAEKVVKGGQVPAHGFCPPGIGGYTTEASMPTDFEAARRLLAEAGYPNGEGFPAVELLYPTSKAGMQIVEALQATWKKELNVDISLRNEEYKVYLDTQRKLDYDLSISIWIADYPDPNTYLDMMLTGNGNNDTGWGHPRYDELIRSAGRTMDTAKRFALFQEAEALLLEEAPVLPIFFGTHVYLCRPEVQNYAVSSGGVVIHKNIDLPGR